MQEEIHQAQAVGGADNLPAMEGFILEKLLLVARELVFTGDIPLRGEEETTAAAGRVYDGLAGFGAKALDHRFDERARGRVSAPLLVSSAFFCRRSS